MAFDTALGTMFRGDDRTVSIAVKESDGVTAQNITGWSLWLTAKLAILDLDAAAVFMLEIGAGIVVDNAAGGLATASIANTQTNTLTALSTTLYLDIQGKDGGGKVKTLATYTMIVLAEITRKIV